VAKLLSGPIKTKAKCCKDKPRCKKCPVVCKRLSMVGKAERIDKRNYVLIDVTKADLKLARAR
jgi:aldehyde:ferredoxin oxidoreductase